VTEPGLTRADVALLRCPKCRSRVVFDGRERDGLVHEGKLACVACVRSWPVRGGLPDLVNQPELQGTDRIAQWVYDALGRFHDPAVDLLLPVLQGDFSQTGRESRLRYCRRLDLDAGLAVPSDEPFRILDVGIGGGANVTLLDEQVPRSRRVEYWGVDISRGMLKHCRAHVRRGCRRRVRLALGDAHALPFATGSFDRVFHVGAIASYRDPRKGLSEMARVAKPGTPIVVVDEQLTPEARRSLYRRLTFAAVTAFANDVEAPTWALPYGAELLSEEAVTPFYYCMTFRWNAA
jgi:ubiquinone/menaquinone biosynthesis C-methylase UbiE/uncharacterized protein YbaR (Trm112 family)